MGRKLEDALKELSDEELQELSDACHGVSPHTHSLQSCINALSGVFVDAEISRREIEKLRRKKEKGQSK